MSLVIWTRSLDDWEEDHKYFAQLGVEALHLPCVSMHALPIKFPKQKPQVFVFTSATAVQYAAKHLALVNLMRSAEAVYAIGPSTQAALKAHKVSAEVPGDVQLAEQLAVWLSRNLSPDTTVAWPSAREPSYNLQSHLARYNIIVDVLPVYYTDRALLLPNGKAPEAKDIERYIQALEGSVCFGSTSAVEGFTNTLMPSQNRLKKALTAVAIGPTTALAAKDHFEKVITVAEPSFELLAKVGTQHG